MPRIAVAVCAATLLLGACSNKTDTTTSASPDRTLQAGVNDAQDKNIAVLAFLPAEATVEAGSQVTWNFPGPEPHVVFFPVAGQQPPGPDDPTATQPIAGAAYDGSAKVSSGINPTGPTAAQFKLKFPKAGAFTYYCAIHPGMQGKITVVASGQKADTQAELRSRARTEADSFLAEGRAAKQKLTSASPKKTTNPDGSTTWTVEMGAGTQHTAVLAFAPIPANVKKGDKVVFVNNSNEPHTASFAGTKTLPANPESAEAMKAAPGKSPQTLNATAFFNTGWLPPNVPPGSAPPLAARSFTFKVATAGTYAYVCLLHASSGMTGTIVAT